MQCPTDVIPAEYYFGAIMLVVGGLVRLAKRLPFVKPDHLPFMAFCLGWAIDGAAGNAACGESYTMAAVTALAGGVAGLASVGGHEIIIRTARSVSPALGAMADRLLGKASEQYEQQTGKPAPTETEGDES
jgi:hypothetical protein